MGGSERGQDRLEDHQCVGWSELAALAQQVAQRAAVHVLHRQEHVAVVVPLVEDRHHIGVRQPGRRFGFANEPRDELVVFGEELMHDLERHDAVEPGVEGPVDSGHPAARDACLDAVAAVEHAADQGIRNLRVHGVESRPRKRQCLVRRTESRTAHTRAWRGAPVPAREDGLVQPGVVLFDLDGTLTESGPGIMRSLGTRSTPSAPNQLDQATMLRFVGPAFAAIVS